VEESKKEVAPAPKESVGVDVGIESFATLSDDEAALVGYGDLEPGFNKRINLAPPEIPELREAVREYDQRAFALDHGAQPDAVRFDQSKFTLFQFVSPM
jgi:hypothetical protein